MIVRGTDGLGGSGAANVELLELLDMDMHLQEMWIRAPHAGPGILTGRKGVLAG